MHDDIKTFTLEGELADSNLVQEKDRLVEFLEGQIRDLGSVPVLDLEPQFTLEYLPKSETYEFTLTIYGVPIEGEDDAWSLAGMMNGKIIPKDTQKDK